MPRVRLFGRRRDAGGVAVVVGILFAASVLLGVGALAVDVGQLYAEREELQSGADAAATAVAIDCALRPSECSNYDLTAQTYANRNAKDGLTAIQTNGVCGTVSPLPACTAPAVGNLTDCIGIIPPSVNYVQVRTRTQSTGSDPYILPATFAETLAGKKAGTSVGACSRVAWGSPSSGIALTFSQLCYDQAVNASKIAPPPPIIPTDDYEVVLQTHGNDSTCKVSQSGQNLPGGYGWADHTAQCDTIIQANGSYGNDTGNGTPHQDCETIIQNAIATKTPVSLPIFEDTTGNGSGGTYHLLGFAAFVITGYYLPAMHPKEVESWLGASPCSGNDNCIYGYFTKAVVEWDGSFGTKPTLGATVVKTIG